MLLSIIKEEIELKYSIRKISVVVIIVLLLVMLPVMPKTFAVNVTEVESNNTIGTANVTQDDYTNYGAISSASDVDWWKITFTKSGFANFWLSTSPTGCDYDLYFYSGSSTGSYPDYDAKSTRSGRTQELIKANVRAGSTYYVKIVSYSGSSTSNYTFRIKRYDYKKTRFFTSDTAEGNFSIAATNTLPHLWGMGLDAGEYLHNHANTALNSLNSTDIFIFRGHGLAGRIAFHTEFSTIPSRLFANQIDTDHPNDATLNSLDDSALSSMILMVFGGCYTSLDHNTRGDLVDKALELGSFCVIGWEDTINRTTANGWVEQFFAACANGYDAEAAMAQADSWALAHHSSNAGNIMNRGVGTSRPAALSLAK